MDDHAFYLANELIDELTKQFEQENYLLVDFVKEQVKRLEYCHYPRYKHYIRTHDKWDNHIPHID